MIYFLFFFNDTATTEIYTLSLHDALPIYSTPTRKKLPLARAGRFGNYTYRGSTFARIDQVSGRVVSSDVRERSEEHTSELQSPCNLVCRLLLEKKNKQRLPEVEREIYDHK